MKISIVTISYNQAPYLQRAIESVLSQSNCNLEYIVVDAGSTDGSRDIIERYRSDISRIIFEPDQGPPDGLNKGFAAATGEIGGYLNADDEFLPGALGEVTESFRTNPSADVIYGDGYIVDERGRITRQFLSTPFSVRSYVYGRTWVMQQATFFRMDAFRAAGGFNVESRTIWDSELLVDLALNGARMLHVPRKWAFFRIHGGSITGSARLKGQYLEECRRVFHRIMNREPNYYDSAIRGVNRATRLISHPGRTIRRAAEIVRSHR